MGVSARWVGDDGEQVAREEGKGKGRFVVCDIGETLVFP